MLIMYQLPGYTLKKLIDSNEENEFYEGYSFLDEKEVLIRLFKSSTPKLLELHEEIQARTNQRENILLHPIKIERKDGYEFGIYEPISFQTSLSSYISKEQASLTQFFFLSIELTSILEEYHRQRKMVGVINPNDILIDFEQENVFILDLENSYVVRKDNQPLVNFLYSSPEFTGKMGKEADFRSDLYSLGIIFYEILTRKFPFQKGDPLELLHSHFTQIPISPSAINPEIPNQLSMLVLKLLEKSPENRYQSAYGLCRDLEKCWEQFSREGFIQNFSLGLEDPFILERKIKIIGREHELKTLQSTFEEVELGYNKALLICGDSGSGKTALVREFREINSKKNVIYISGKWDQFERNVPYGPIIQAFTSFFRIIVSQGDDSIQKWRNLFLHNLGDRCQIIADIVPEFLWIVGEQAFEEKINIVELQNSILIAFQQFLSTITEEITIVLFMDDIQWADQPSMELLRYVIQDNQINNIFFILASRSPETSQQLNIKQLLLDPLKEEEIETWLIQRYGFQQDCSSLVTYIKTVSQGNPFFIHQILLTLEKENLIYWNRNTRVFEFKLGDVAGNLIGKDVIAHLNNKLLKMSDKVKYCLDFASCLGTKFNLSEISIATQIPKEELINDLYFIAEEGFIYFLEGYESEKDISFSFLHDSVQQAIYSSINEVKKRQIHLTIGKQLRSYYERTNLGNIFKLADHFNISADLLTISERLELAHLNANAGENAKNSAAFEAAYRYFSKGKDLLDKECWEHYYDLAYRIYNGLGVCAYLNSKFEEAEKAFEVILKNSKTNEEKLYVYNLKLTQYTHLNKVKEAVESGTTGLKLFGWKLDRSIMKWDILKELLLIQWLLRGKKPEELLNLPPMTNQRNKLIMQSLISMNAPTYHVNQNLATYLMLRAFRWTLEHGDTDITALVYNNYSLIMSAGFGNFEKSYQFGNLAIRHVEKSQSISLKARVYFVYGSFVNHWKNPISKNLEYLYNAQKYCLQVGNFHLAGACSSFIVMTQLIKGEQLPQILDEIDRQFTLVNKIQYKISIGFMSEVKSWLQWLSKIDNNQPTEFIQYEEDPSAFIIHNTIRLQMSYIMDNENEAWKIIEELNKTVTKSLVLVMAPEFYFYQTLWLCRFYQRNVKRNQLQIAKLLKRNLKVMKKWANHSPNNYEHKYLLMKFEALTVLNPEKINESWYEQAVELALNNGFFQDAAIICECAGNHYLSKGLSRLGKHYITEAHELFGNWGATRKQEMLRNKYIGFFETVVQSKKAFESIDMESFHKASRSISSEIVLENLINTFMNIVVENAGATSGHLFLTDEIGLYLATADREHLERNNQSSTRLENIKEIVPVKLIHYIQKSLEPIILHNADEEGLFKSEPQIRRNKIKSIIALPLLHHNQLIGILYLENNLMSHAFTEKDLLLLNTLASQAAISIQNAQLYLNLEEKVKSRTFELEKANLDLEKANKKLADSEKTRLELLSNISHDLKNPLTSIQGYIEAMLDGIVISPEKQITYLRRSKEKLYSLNRLIQDLFELSKLQYGNMSFMKEIVRADKLFFHLCEQHEWEIEQSGLFFSYKVNKKGTDLYPLVEVDIKRMGQVFQNIISNSIKHTKMGGIYVQLKIEENYVVFQVIDTGEGIPTDEIDKIFERSFTSKKSSNTDGNGLGLSICKEIILHHQGEIWAESVVGEGTSLFFSIPILQVDHLLTEELETTSGI